MKLVIQATAKLNKLVETTGKMIGDSIKALAIAESKKFDPTQDKDYFKDVRAKALEGQVVVEEEDKKKEEDEDGNPKDSEEQ